MSDLSIDAIEDALRRVLEIKNRSPWFDSDGAAEYLSCSPATLKVWRSRGEGPRYHIVHTRLVRYHVEDLDAFVRGEVAR